LWLEGKGATWSVCLPNLAYAFPKSSSLSSLPLSISTTTTHQDLIIAPLTPLLTAFIPVKFVLIANPSSLDQKFCHLQPSIPHLYHPSSSPFHHKPCYPRRITSTRLLHRPVIENPSLPTNCGCLTSKTQQRTQLPLPLFPISLSHKFPRPVENCRPQSMALH
jgi:hypothetical protein